MATTVCNTLVHLPLSEILIKPITLKWKQPKIVILLFESSILQFAMINTILKFLLEASMWKLSPPIYCKLNSRLVAPPAEVAPMTKAPKQIQVHQYVVNLILSVRAFASLPEFRIGNLDEASNLKRVLVMDVQCLWHSLCIRVTMTPGEEPVAEKGLVGLHQQQIQG